MCQKTSMLNKKNVLQTLNGLNAILCVLKIFLKESLDKKYYRICVKQKSPKQLRLTLWSVVTQN